MKKKFTKIEQKNFFEGFDTGREDWSYCKGDYKKIGDCIKERYALRKLCYQRNDKNGVSFQNGYLSFFFEKMKGN